MAVSLSAAPAGPLLEWEQTNCPLCRLASLYCLLTGQSDCITATAVRPTARYLRHLIYSDSGRLLPSTSDR